MAPLHLDYLATAPGQRLPGAILLAAGLLLTGALLAWSAQLDARLAASDEALAHLRQVAERSRLQAAASAAVTAPDHLPASPTARRWEALFTSLEGAAAPDVTLLGLAPGAQRLVLTGEAANVAAALDYTGRLQAVPALRTAHLAQYEVVREQPRQPVRFTVQVDWPEGGP